MKSSNPAVGTEFAPWWSIPACPDCGGRVWHFGPRGGAAYNIRCLGCHAWFNVVIAAALGMIQRIGQNEVGHTYVRGLDEQ